MSLYQVLQRPEGVVDPLPNSGAVFIKDRFSWLAGLLPPVWAIVHGLWLELVIWIAAMIALGAASMIIGDEAVFWLNVLVAILIGLEATNIRTAALRRKGYQPLGDIIAGAEDLAEMEFIKRGSMR